VRRVEYGRHAYESHGLLRYAVGYTLSPLRGWELSPLASPGV